MAKTAAEVAQDNEAASIRGAAKSIEGLLDSDGQYNPGDRKSRAHPDYDGDDGAPQSREGRDENGRFKRRAEASDDEDDTSDIESQAREGDAEPEDTVNDSDTDEQLADSAVEEAEDGDEDTVKIESLQDLADTLELSPDELMEQLSHTFKAADEEVSVTLSELVKGYQKDADYRRNTAKLAEERQTLENEQQTRVQEVTAHNHVLAQNFQLAEQLLTADLYSQQMQQLRERNPNEWSARRQEISERLQQLQNSRQQMAQRYQQFVTSEAQNTRQREQTALLQRKPDFSNADREKAKDAIASIGFSPAEVSQVMDHRLILSALELADLRAEVTELRELKEKGRKAANRLTKEVPKMQKPGKQTPGRKAVRVKQSRLQNLRKQATKTGRVEDAARVIENMDII